MTAWDFSTTWKHWLADHFVNYWVIVNYGVLAFYSQLIKMHFPAANLNVKSNPGSVCNVWCDLSTDWHRRGLMSTTAMSARFWVWFFSLWPELNAVKTCCWIWWAFIDLNSWSHLWNLFDDINTGSSNRVTPRWQPNKETWLHLSPYP